MIGLIGEAIGGIKRLVEGPSASEIIKKSGLQGDIAASNAARGLSAGLMSHSMQGLGGLFR